MCDGNIAASRRFACPIGPPIDPAHVSAAAHGGSTLAQTAIMAIRLPEPPVAAIPIAPLPDRLSRQLRQLLDIG